MDKSIIKEVKAHIYSDGEIVARSCSECESFEPHVYLGGDFECLQCKPYLNDKVKKINNYNYIRKLGLNYKDIDYVVSNEVDTYFKCLGFEIENELPKLLDIDKVKLKGNTKCLKVESPHGDGGVQKVFINSLGVYVETFDSTNTITGYLLYPFINPTTRLIDFEVALETIVK